MAEKGSRAKPWVEGVPEAWAAIFNIWPDEPIYHALDARPDRRASSTVCGREIAVDLPLIPLKHAVKFARLCSSCEALAP